MRNRTPSKPARLPIWAKITIAGLVGLAAWSSYQVWDKARRAPETSDPQIEFLVEGLDCPFWCAVRLTQAIDGLDGARVERWDQAAGSVVVRHDPARQNQAALRATIEAAGFPVLDLRAAK